MESLRAALAALERGEAFAWVTVLSVQGSSPGQPGQKMILYPDGRQEGTVGGGAMERTATADALRMLREGKGGVLKIQMNPDAPDSVGAVCGGSALLSVEVFPATMHLLLCGAGHLALALGRLCGELGYFHTVVDERAELATGERFPLAREVVVDSPARYIEKADLRPYSHLIILTHDHVLDRETLGGAWKSGFDRYIGMVGSKRKWLEVRTDLEGRGVPPAWLDAVHCPIGLSIGARTPAEIAVAVVAEILQVKGGSR